MTGAAMRSSAVLAVERVRLVPLLGIVMVGAASLVLGPVMLTSALIGLAAAMVFATRPQWGVGVILFLLMVQYGSRRYERGGIAGILSAVLPEGTGLLTPNNVLGLFLALVLVYHLYHQGDWSFLRSRVVQLMLAITAVLVFSAFVSGVTPAERAEVGLLATSAQDPSRLLVSRALFLVLFVFFIRNPRDLRMIVALFIGLAILTAWSGAGAAITGTGRSEVATYRAGGTQVLIESTQNPNRLAMICTLGLVFLWEYSQAHALRRWARWLAMGAVLLMILTVFLSASRGGLLGLTAAGAMLFIRRRGGGGRRFFYGVAMIIVAAMLIQEVVPEQALERITNIPGITQSTPGGTVGGGSIERRKYTYEIGFDIWKHAPVVGVGPGNWPYVRFLTDPLRSAAAAHNSYLAALAEGGLLTLTLYLWLFFIVIRDLGRCERDPTIVARAKADRLGWVVAGTRICLLTFMLFSAFADLWDLVFSYFLLGVAAVVIQRYQPGPRVAMVRA